MIHKAQYFFHITEFSSFHKEVTLLREQQQKHTFLSLPPLLETKLTPQTDYKRECGLSLLAHNK